VEFVAGTELLVSDVMEYLLAKFMIIVEFVEEMVQAAIIHVPVILTFFSLFSSPPKLRKKITYFFDFR
jgi:hypothetical protein